MATAIAQRSRKEIFDFMDLDKDGKLSVADTKFSIRAVGIVASEADLAQFTKDGVSFDQYSKFIDGFVAEKRYIIDEDCQLQLLKELRVAFDRMDKRNKGSIPLTELKHYLTTVGEKIDSKEFDEVFRNQKSTGINFEKFFKTIIGKSTYKLRQ
jgi:Ca2+-binding EF-hand superfamily protein